MEGGGGHSRPNLNVIELQKFEDEETSKGNEWPRSGMALLIVECVLIAMVPLVVPIDNVGVCVEILLIAVEDTVKNCGLYRVFASCLF